MKSELALGICGTLAKALDHSATVQQAHVQDCNKCDGKIHKICNRQHGGLLTEKQTLLHQQRSVGVCVLGCVCAGQRRVCPGRRVRCPVLQMSVAATSPADPPRHPNSECPPHSSSIIAPSMSSPAVVSLFKKLKTFKTFPVFSSAPSAMNRSQC